LRSNTGFAMHWSKIIQSSGTCGNYLIEFRITGKNFFFYLEFRRKLETTIGFDPNESGGLGLCMPGDWFRYANSQESTNEDCIQAMESFNHMTEGRLDNQYGDAVRKCAWRIILCRSILFP
jgi:hypothetical protein